MALSSVKEFTTTYLGRNISLKRIGQLSIRFVYQPKPVIMLRGYTMADLNIITRELTARVATIRSNA